MATYESVQTIKPPEETTATVDMNIVEYLYTCPLNDIMADDNLIKLVVNNGYYKSVLCEANQIQTMTITLDGQQYLLSGPGEDQDSMYDILTGKAKIVLCGTNIIDSSQ
jgi:hypothetical protein